jgi:hypothetical protein
VNTPVIFELGNFPLKVLYKILRFLRL